MVVTRGYLDTGNKRACCYSGKEGISVKVQPSVFGSQSAEHFVALEHAPAVRLVEPLQNLLSGQPRFKVIEQGVVGSEFHAPGKIEPGKDEEFHFGGRDNRNALRLLAQNRSLAEYACFLHFPDLHE